MQSAPLMRHIAFTVLLLVVACATPRAIAPTTATVFIAPVVCSPYVKDGLPRDLVAEFDRRLRLTIDMEQVGAEDEADYVVQTVLTFADVKIRESMLYGFEPSLYWDEVLIGSITVTDRRNPTQPVVVPVPPTGGVTFLTSYHPSVPVLIKVLRGCQIDPISGDVTNADGERAWMPGVAHVQGLGERGGSLLCESLGLPSKFPPRFEFVESPGDQWESMQLFELTNALSISYEIHSGNERTHFFWSRTHPVLSALISRERLRDKKLDADDLRLLSSILDRIAHYVGEHGPWEDRWGIESYAELCEWLVARMRDDYDAFRDGYKQLLTKGIEPEFCKAVYKRWPPASDVFRNPYTR